MKQGYFLIELVLILLVAGIFFSITVPLDKDKVFMQGAMQVLNDLRYTRFLAMTHHELHAYDLSVSKKGVDYYKARWQLYFIESSKSTDYMQTYTLFLDKNGDGNANLFKSKPERREIAQSLTDLSKLMTSGQSGIITKDHKKASPLHNIAKKYGITDILLRGACKNNSGRGSTRIIFNSHGNLLSTVVNSNRRNATLQMHKEGACLLILLGKKDLACIEIDTLTGKIWLKAFQNLNTRQIRENTNLSSCSDLALLSL